MRDIDDYMCSCALQPSVMDFYEWNDEGSLFWLAVGLFGGIVGTLCLINTCFCIYLCLKRSTKDSYSFKERVSSSSSMEDTTMRLQTVVTLDDPDEEQHKTTSFEADGDEQMKPDKPTINKDKEVTEVGVGAGSEKLVQVSIPLIPSPGATVNEGTKSVKFDIPTVVIPDVSNPPSAIDKNHDTPAPPSVGIPVESTRNNDQPSMPAGKATTMNEMLKHGAINDDIKVSTSDPPPQAVTGSDEVSKPPPTAATDGAKDDSLDNMFQDILDFSLLTPSSGATNKDKNVTSIEL